MVNLDNFILFDVANAIITDKGNGEKFLNKFLTTSNITQSSSETEIRGGQGAGLVGIIESEKSIEITIANSVISRQWLSMQQGAEFVEGSKVVMSVTEKGTVVVADDSDPNDISYKVVFAGTPHDSEKSLTISNCEGQTAVIELPLVGGEFLIPDDFETKAGEEVTIVYKKEVTGDVLEIDSAVFPKGWELQLEVPAKDRCTGVVTHKVVFIFDNVTPSSSFDLGFAMGEAIAPEMTLKVMKSCCSTGLGRMVIVPITP